MIAAPKPKEICKERTRWPALEEELRMVPSQTNKNGPLTHLTFVRRFKCNEGHEEHHMNTWTEWMIKDEEILF